MTLAIIARRNLSLFDLDDVTGDRSSVSFRIILFFAYQDFEYLVMARCNSTHFNLSIMPKNLTPKHLIKDDMHNEVVS